MHRPYLAPSFDIDTDLALAKQVQASFLPKDVPSVAGIELFADSQAAYHVGGDFYDFVTGPHGNQFFAIGDVSYKGVSAALMMAILYKVLRTSIKVLDSPRPQAILNYVNEDIYAELAANGMFATAFIGEFQPDFRRLRFSNAGHSPVIYRQAGGSAEILVANNVPLGVLLHESYVDSYVGMEPDDLLIVFTDGYVDSQNHNGKQFGYERLLRLVDAVADQSAKVISNAIYEEAASFGAGMHRHDDQAFVIVKGVSL